MSPQVLKQKSGQCIVFILRPCVPGTRPASTKASGVVTAAMKSLGEAWCPYGGQWLRQDSFAVSEIVGA